MFSSYQPGLIHTEFDFNYDDLDSSGWDSILSYESDLAYAAMSDELCDAVEDSMQRWTSFINLFEDDEYIQLYK